MAQVTRILSITVPQELAHTGMKDDISNDLQ